MIEISGDAWTLIEANPQSCLCITTNGDIRKDGEAVMGRGIALQAKKRYPDLPRRLARLLQTNGNIFQYMGYRLFAFPTKHRWQDNSDIALIIQSAEALAKRANAHPLAKYLLPRPGCSNGHLNWKDVKEAIAPILPDNVYIVGGRT